MVLVVVLVLVLVVMLVVVDHRTAGSRLSLNSDESGSNGSVSMVTLS